MWERENLDGGLDALSLGLFTRILGWKKVEVDIFLTKVRAELNDTKFHTYWDM